MTARKKPIAEELGLGEGFSPYDLTGAQRAALVEWFFATFIRHTKGRLAGQTVKLADWQRDNIIRPVFGTLDRRKRRRYDTALIGIPRKNAKSQIAAGVAGYGLFIEALWEPGMEVYSLAGDKDQARLVFEETKRVIQADPFLDAYARCYKDVIYVPELQSEYRVLPANAGGQLGLNPGFVIYDEFLVAPNLELYEALTTGTVVRQEPLTFIVTTAGKSRKGPLWEMLKSKPSRSQYRWWCGAPEGADPTSPKVWRAANPGKWVPMAYIRKRFEDPQLSMAAFEAFHLNRFPMAAGTGKAFSAAEWKKCSKRGKLDPERPTVLTIDGAIKGDCFSLLLDQIDETGQHQVSSRIFDDPPPDKGYYDLVLIEDVIVDIAQTYRKLTIAIDPNRLTLLAQRLEDVHGLEIEIFEQRNQLMCSACGLLRSVMREGRVNAGGNGILREHVLNAVELERQPFGWRIGKPSAEERIDGAVTLAMAVYKAEAQAREAGASFASTGGVWTL